MSDRRLPLVSGPGTTSGTPQGAVGAPTTTVEGRAPTVRFLPGGELLVAYLRNPLTGADGRMGIYPLDSRHFVEIACGTEGPSLTGEEWRQFV